MVPFCGHGARILPIRYFQKEVSDTMKLVPEGYSKRVA